MKRHKKIVLALVAFVVLVGGTAFTIMPAYAYGCAHYHTVQRGQYLSWIGRHYGVSWVYIAQVNGIRPPRFVIYPGQVLCIPSGGYYSSYYQPYYQPYNQYNPPVYNPPSYSYTSARTWNVSISNVVQNTSVTALMNNIPANVKFNIEIGRNVNGGYSWIELPVLDTGAGGSIQATYPIPAEFSDSAQLILRVVQNVEGGSSSLQDQWFNNITGDKGIASYNNSPVYYNNYYNPGYQPGYQPPYQPGYPYNPGPGPGYWPGP